MRIAAEESPHRVLFVRLGVEYVGATSMPSMIKQTIQEIEARLQKADSIEEKNKAELLHLVTTLKSEVEQLSRTHGEQAQSIVGFTQVSAHEATRDERDPILVKLAVDGLAASVAELESTHPKLVEIVNRICVTLSNIGI